MQDRAGGLPNVMRNLLEFRDPTKFRYEIVLLDQREYPASRITEDMNAERTNRIVWDSRDNLSKVYLKFGAMIDKPDALLVTNSPLELTAAAYCQLPNPIVHIIHNSYPIARQVPARFQGIVDRFITVSQSLAGKMKDLGVERVRYIAQPVRIPKIRREPVDCPLRIVLAGRMVAAKGLARVPEVDHFLRSHGVAAQWTLIGDGPEVNRVRSAWPFSQMANWTGEIPNEMVLDYLREQDVLLLPSSVMEGMPMVVAEAMARGVVPVVFDLDSGIPELVLHGETGYVCHQRDAAQMGQALLNLHSDRELLDGMSIAAAKHAAALCDGFERAAEYEDVFENALCSPRPKEDLRKFRAGGILDSSRVPNFLSRTIRIHRKYGRRTQ